MPTITYNNVTVPESTIYAVSTRFTNIFSFDFQVNNMLSVIAAYNIPSIATAFNNNLSLEYHNEVLYVAGTTNNSLNFVNLEASTSTRIGNIDNFGVNETTPVALASHNGTLYMLGASTQALYTLDIGTGAATRVGNSLGFGVNESFPTGLASHNGTLYLVGASQRALFTLNTSTGVASRIGNSISFGQNIQYPGALVSSENTLYIAGGTGGLFANTLYVLSPDTGIASMARPINAPEPLVTPAFTTLSVNDLTTIPGVPINPTITYPTGYQHPTAGSSGTITLGNISQPDGTVANRTFRLSDAVQASGSFNMFGLTIPREFEISTTPAPTGSLSFNRPSDAYIGTVLTAAVSSQQNVDSISYQWHRGGQSGPVISTSDTYTLQYIDSDIAISCFATLTGPGGTAVLQSHWGTPNFYITRVLGAQGPARPGGFTNSNYYIGSRGNFQTTGANSGSVVFPNNLGTITLARQAVAANAFLVEFVAGASQTFDRLRFRRQGFSDIEWPQSSSFSDPRGSIHRWRWNADTRGDGNNAERLTNMAAMFSTGITGTTTTGPEVEVLLIP